MKEDILGLPVDRNNGEICVNQICDHILEGDPCKWLACINPHSYAVSLSDKEFSTALQGADWLVPDGAGVLLASILLGGSIRTRITGSDIFYGVHKRLNESRGLRVFFLGSTEDTLSAIREKMKEDFPNIEVAGTYSPPFSQCYSDSEIDKMIDAINQGKPDVLWVGMTAPKQEKWIFQNRHRINVRFAAAIGAVFDFYIGKVKRSPSVFQRLGLEWLPRLIQQPKRLWRRTFVSAPIFLFHVFIEKFKRA